MISYPEKAGVELEALFFDNQNNPAVPSTVHWRLDCATTKKELVDDWIQVPVVIDSDEAGNVLSVTATITIPGHLNSIQWDRNRRETKTLLVVSNKDLDSEYSQDYSYVVNNLQGRT